MEFIVRVSDKIRSLRLLSTFYQGFPWTINPIDSGNTVSLKKTWFPSIEQRRWSKPFTNKGRPS